MSVSLEQIRLLPKERIKYCPGNDNYAVTSLGRMFRLASAGGARPGMVVGTNVSPGGYKRVCLRAGTRSVFKLVHRLVLIAFSGQNKGAGWDARHYDGNKLNNVLANLRWGSRADNERDKIAHGKSNRGERHGLHKLTEEAVKVIRESTETTTVLASRFKVSRRAVRDVRLRRRWKHV